jgi:SAM-dependent methyltransferase
LSTSDLSGYVFDQTFRQEHDRLRALEDLFDPATTRHLADLGLAKGRRCLEVGAGAGSIARWLARRVGPGGQVLATDLDPRFLAGQHPANLQVRRHDILTDPLPDGWFDLAHARAVLEHLPERERVLARMVAAVRPGGWVVVEDLEFGGGMQPALARYADPPEHAALVERVGRGMQALFAAAGADPGFAARLPRVLRQAGLEQVGGAVHAPPLEGSVQGDFVHLTLQSLRARLVSTGLLADQDVQRVLELTATPSFRHLPFVAVSAWGRRPLLGSQD